MTKYPKQKSEQQCAVEKRMMMSLRTAYKQKCIDEREAKKRILGEV
jgi:hypothetical protein